MCAVLLEAGRGVSQYFLDVGSHIHVKLTNKTLNQGSTDSTHRENMTSLLLFLLQYMIL